MDRNTRNARQQRTWIGPVGPDVPGRFRNAGRTAGRRTRAGLPSGPVAALCGRRRAGARRSPSAIPGRHRVGRPARVRGSGTERPSNRRTRLSGANRTTARARPSRYIAVSPRHSHTPHTTAARRCARNIAPGPCWAAEESIGRTWEVPAVTPCAMVIPRPGMARVHGHPGGGERHRVIHAGRGRGLRHAGRSVGQLVCQVEPQVQQTLRESRDTDHGHGPAFPAGDPPAGQGRSRERRTQCPPGQQVAGHQSVPQCARHHADGREDDRRQRAWAANAFSGHVTRLAGRATPGRLRDTSQLLVPMGSLPLTDGSGLSLSYQALHRDLSAVRRSGDGYAVQLAGLRLLHHGGELVGAHLDALAELLG